MDDIKANTSVQIIIITTTTYSTNLDTLEIDIQNNIGVYMVPLPKNFQNLKPS
jgi:hypothetical protein